MSGYKHVSLVKVWPEHCEQPWTYPSLLKYRRVEVHGTFRFEEEQTGAVVADVEAFEEWLRKIQEVAWEEGHTAADPLAHVDYRYKATNPHRI